MSPIPNPEIRLPKPRLPRRRSGSPGSSPRSRQRRGVPTVTGLHIEPGEAVAVEARLDRGLVVSKAGAAMLPHGMVRDGEVVDPEELGKTLKELFVAHGLGKRVRVGVANQRTVMRTIDLPPLRNAADIEAAIRINAADHIAMPLEQALTDHQVLGTVDTPEGPRTRVVVAAADRESVEGLLEALRVGGLRPEGLDLSAFALVRALHDPQAEATAPILYAQVAGMTTLAVAEGAACRFTRVARTGLDSLTEQLAERDGVSHAEAHERLLATGLETLATDAVARDVLESGADELADHLRTSLEFFGMQWGHPVAEVVLTGSALELAGLVNAVERRLGLAVRTAGVSGPTEELQPWRLAVAAGLAVEEVRA